MPAHHELKIWPVFFGAVERGDKTFEFRKNDRFFQTGDQLLLREFDPTKAPPVAPPTAPRASAFPGQLPSAPAGSLPGYTGARIRCKISYVLAGPEFDVPLGYAILAITDVRRDDEL